MKGGIQTYFETQLMYYLFSNLQKQQILLYFIFFLILTNYMYNLPMDILEFSF